MFRKILSGSVSLCMVQLIVVSAAADGLHEAAGVNLSAEEGFGARHSGSGITFAGFQRDANAVANAPAAMNDVDDFAFATGHAEKFGEAKYDDFAFLIPFEANSTMGLGLARYGVSNIDSRPAGYHPSESIPAGQFSIADYLVVAGFSRRWGDPRAGVVDVGTALHVLYRQLDQDGLGVRADAMAQYTIENRYRVGAILKGLIPSSARWESGYAEYESPDIQLGLGARFPAPYFYGALDVAYQTEGIFQQRAKSQVKASGGRFYQDLKEGLADGNLGAEFLFDFGLSLRAGLSEMYFTRDLASQASFGIGYSWRGLVGLDYSFTPHPDLSASHRISLQFVPFFPNFKGRGFRNEAFAETRGPAKPQPAHAVPPESRDDDPPEEKSGKGSPAGDPVTPVPEGNNASPGGKPAPASGDKEILEQEE